MKKVIAITFVLLCSISAFSQKALHRKAEKCIKRFEFVSAAYKYKKIVNKNPQDEKAWERLAYCYQMLNFHETERPPVRRNSYQVSILVSRGK